MFSAGCRARASPSVRPRGRRAGGDRCETAASRAVFVSADTCARVHAYEGATAPPAARPRTGSRSACSRARPSSRSCRRHRRCARATIRCTARSATARSRRDRRGGRSRRRRRAPMSASTASSAGRFAWMSEISAYRISAPASPGARHITVADAGHAPELAGRANRVGHRVARRLREAEAREVALRRRRQQIERVNAARLRLGDDPLDELRAERRDRATRRDGGRAQQRVLAADLDSDHADDVAVALGDDERAERFAHAVERQPLAASSASTAARSRASRDAECDARSSQLACVMSVTSSCEWVSRAAARRAARSPYASSGFVARTNALMNFPSISRANGAASSPTARERRRILRLVDARRLDRRVLEARVGEQPRELHLLERAGDAADPQLHVPAHRGRHLAAHDDVGHREPAAGLQHAKRFGAAPALVAREVDHAVGDDDVDRCSGSGMPRSRPSGTRRSSRRPPLVLVREREHLVGHVEAVRLPGRPDAPRRQQHVDAAAGAEVEHRSPARARRARWGCRSRATRAAPRGARRSRRSRRDSR